MSCSFKTTKSYHNYEGFSINIRLQSLNANKVLVDEGSEFYKKLIKSWLQENSIDMYSSHNEGKSVVAENFITTLKSKIYKDMTSVSKNVYIDKLDDSFIA